MTAGGLFAMLPYYQIRDPQEANPVTIGLDGDMPTSGSIGLFGSSQLVLLLIQQRRNGLLE
jgi:hypothetical protein